VSRQRTHLAILPWLIGRAGPLFVILFWPREFRGLPVASGCRGL